MIDYTFWAIAVTAVLIVALSKAGLLGALGMVGVPLLSIVMPPRDAAGMMLPLLLVMDVFAVWNYRKDADWRILKIMLPGALVGMAIGWLLWAVVSDAIVLLFLGLITLAFVIDAVLPLRKKLENLHPSRPWGTFWGGIAGFTSFISHTGGPPFQMYVLPQKLPPARYAGTGSFFFAMVNTAKLVPYFFLGQLNVSNLSVAAVLAPLAAVGVLLGVWLVRRIQARLFYQIAYALVFLVAIKLVYDGVEKLFLTGATA